MDIDPDNSFALAVDGLVQTTLHKNLAIAFGRYNQAVNLNPNDALAWLLKGTLHAFVDEGRDAVSYTQRARSLSPLDPHKYYFESLAATALIADKQYSEALRLAESSLQANHRHSSTLRVKTAALHFLGRDSEASNAAKQLMQLEPNLTVSGWLDKHPAASFSTGKEWARALSAAGVPS